MGSALKDGPLLITAAGLADASRSVPGPVAVLVEGLRVLAVGRPEAVGGHPGAGAARRVDLSGSVLLPGLVNAHTHLDLTHVGPIPYDPAGGFVGWLGQVVSRRAPDPDGIRASVQRGIALSLRGGVVAVGDIAGVSKLEPIEELRDSPLIGVSFLEFFAIGSRAEVALARTGEALAGAACVVAGQDRVRLGLSPHAPYTVGMDSYRWAARECPRRGIALCTHLAESPEEHMLIASGGSAFVALLQRLGVWDDAVAAEFGRGESPVAHLAPVLREGPAIAVHVNDCSDADLEVLASTGTTVLYCPRSSEYFHQRKAFGAHRYRDMLSAGVTVALGTDSIMNLPPEQSDRLSTLDEMRLLWRRDGTDPATLLAMATTNGARALGLEESRFRFPEREATVAGITAVPVDLPNPQDPLAAALESTHAPMLILPEIPE